LIEPDLRGTALDDGSQEVMISVLVRLGVDMHGYFTRYRILPAVEFDHYVGLTAANNLLKIGPAPKTWVILTKGAHRSIFAISRPWDMKV
jgi:hypothetical protein